MSQHTCRNICRIYDADADFRTFGNKTFRKFCAICNLELISRYHNCPCCHKSFEIKS